MTKTQNFSKKLVNPVKIAESQPQIILKDLFIEKIVLLLTSTEASGHNVYFIVV